MQQEAPNNHEATDSFGIHRLSALLDKGITKIIKKKNEEILD